MPDRHTSTTFNERIVRLISTIDNIRIDFANGVFPFSSLLLIESRKLALHLVGIPPISSNLDINACLYLTEKYEETGWQVLHIWEDLYNHKPDVVSSRILARLGQFTRIHARQTSAWKLTKAQAIDFLSEHHLSVPLAGRFAYGLFLKDNLVGVATFGPLRPMTRDGKKVLSGELIRFGSLKGTVVTGGLGKLLEAFRNDHQPDDIMTYADRDWSNGASYRALGFSLIEATPPLPFWLSPEGVRFYPSQVSTQQDEALIQQGYNRIHSTGNLKFIRFYHA